MSTCGESMESDEESQNSDYYYSDKFYNFSDSPCRCFKCRTYDSYVYCSPMTPIVSTNAPKLKEIVSVSVAASLWNHVNIPRALSPVNHRCTTESEEWRMLCNEVFNLTNELPVPKSVAEDIGRYVDKMQDEITHWVSYHFRTVFLKKGFDNEVYNLVYHIVWHQIGAINYEQTARSMLTCLRLSEIEKFKFLCTYCLKDEIELLPPLLFLNTLLEYVNFDEYPLIYYWYCYFRNELQKIPVTGGLSVDTFMFQHTEVDNWPAKEYFLDRLNWDEQVRQAIWLIDEKGYTYHKLILMKLSETQRVLVYMERAVEIMRYTSSEDILPRWFDIRNIITRDQFVSLFGQMLRYHNNHIALKEIWSSASDDFKHHLLNFNNYEIFKDMLSLRESSVKNDFVCMVLSDANPTTKQLIATEEFFQKYCDDFLSSDQRLPELNRLLDVCIPEVSESRRFKENLVLNSVCIKTRCLNDYSAGNVEAVNELLNKFLSSECVRKFKKNLLVSPDGGIYECIVRHIRAGSKSILPIWHDIRCCITDDVFYCIFNSLLKSDAAESVLCEVWSSASDNFKYNLLSHNNYAILRQMKLSEKSDFLHTVLSKAAPSVKKSIMKKAFFQKYCEDLLACDQQLPKLDRLLNTCLPEIRESTQFKQALFMNSKSMKARCLKDYMTGNVKAVNELLNKFLSRELVRDYKKTLLKSPDGILRCIVTSIGAGSKTILSSWHDVRCLVTEDQFVYLYDELLKVGAVEAILTEIWYSVSDNFKRHLLNYNDHEIFQKIFESHEGVNCVDFVFTILQDTSEDTINHIAKKKFFEIYCQRLLASSKFSMAIRLWKLFLRKDEDLIQIKKNLIGSTAVREQCLSYYSSGDIKGLNEFLNQFLSSNRDLIMEYKRNLISSMDGIRKVFSHLFSAPEIVNVIITDSLPDTNSAYSYMKSIMFSTSTICVLQNLIMTSRLNAAKACIDRYLTSAEDKRMMKGRLISNPTKEMRKILSQCDESYWQSFLLWYFGDVIRVQNFKRSLRVDVLFHELLVECIFTRYDSLLSNCKFKFALEVKFDCLDRFLNWYFQSPSEVKKYKMKRIDSFKDIQVINTLLKNSDNTHLRLIMKWFFQNDVVEIANFKKKYGCKNKRIAELI